MVLALIVALAAAGRTAPAADLTVRATLIRGANGGMGSGSYVLADPALKASLRSWPAAGKWTNYYQITNLTAVIPLNQTRDVRMSDRCTLRIRNLGASRVAIDCIAQDKVISKGTNTLPLIWGADDTNNTAWFVSLQDLGAAPGNLAGQRGKK
jgi:hypothetical protein